MKLHEEFKLYETLWESAETPVTVLVGDKSNEKALTSKVAKNFPSSHVSVYYDTKDILRKSDLGELTKVYTDEAGADALEKVCATMPARVKDKILNNTVVAVSSGPSFNKDIKKKLCSLLIKRGHRDIAEKVWKFDLEAHKDISEVSLDLSTATIKIPTAQGYTFGKLVDTIIDTFKNVSATKTTEALMESTEEFDEEELNACLQRINKNANKPIEMDDRFFSVFVSLSKEDLQKALRIGSNGVYSTPDYGKTIPAQLVDEVYIVVLAADDDYDDDYCTVSLQLSGEHPETSESTHDYADDEIPYVYSEDRHEITTFEASREYFTKTVVPHANEIAHEFITKAWSASGYSDYSGITDYHTPRRDDTGTNLKEAIVNTKDSIMSRYADNVADHIVELEHEKAFADAEWFEDEWYVLEDVKVNPDYYILVMDRPVESLQDAEAIINYAFGFINNADEAFSEGGIVQDEGSNELYVETWVVE